MEQNIDKNTDAYLFGKVVVLKKELEDIVRQEQKDPDEIVEKCQEINSYVDFIAKGSNDLFNTFRLHVFKSNQGFIGVVEGKEIDTTPPRLNDHPR